MLPILLGLILGTLHASQTEPLSDLSNESQSDFGNRNALGFAAIYNNTSTQSGYNLGNDRKTVVEYSGSSFGLGILPEWAFMQQWSLETGLFYVPRKFESKSTQYAMDTIQFSPLARIWLMNHRFSVGFGGYLSYAVGRFKSRNIEETSGLLESYESNGGSRLDYGAVASAQIAIPIFESARAFIDSRYQFGIPKTNLTLQDFDSTENFTDLRFLLGVKTDL